MERDASSASVRNCRAAILGESSLHVLIHLPVCAHLSRNTRTMLIISKDIVDRGGRPNRERNYAGSSEPYNEKEAQLNNCLVLMRVTQLARRSDFIIGLMVVGTGDSNKFKATKPTCCLSAFIIFPIASFQHLVYRPILSYYRSPPPSLRVVLLTVHVGLYIQGVESVTI